MAVKVATGRDGVDSGGPQVVPTSRKIFDGCGKDDSGCTTRRRHGRT